MARIRDFVITEDDWIFSVVCYDLGGAELKCLLRYVPDEEGERVSEKLGRYRKLDFYGPYEFLRKYRPEYLNDVAPYLHLVPKVDITEILKPELELPVIAERATNKRVKRIYEFLSRFIRKERIGITGSFLCGLNAEESDIDLVIYGRENFKMAREVITDASGQGQGQGEGYGEDQEQMLFTAINESLWREIYLKRKPELNYHDFVAHEIRKGHRGVIGSRYFDILYVRDAEELERLDRRNYEIGKRVGYRTIRAEVTDTSFSFDNPAIYGIEHDEIEMVLSFTHTYAGQALADETIEARGMVEETRDGRRRLIVGTTREAKGEWIRSLSLLKSY